ncbi:hypothetical protein IQ249_01145 [Lusitaniella coriacea LEGE 07157]|uniref:Uncharacterized protein n=1 Tax=Lusitaniella coriacea LEGE 07157 TaxID=945747 RepID=A0A8J7B7N0_9CYAN|nr:alr0857 family protein [Lusitaniella coriacea]MBE9114490.1 hypothetical protein [Lusitaniella coriacea LEGE 07157]
MLKLTYVENGFKMELLSQSLEDWVTVRVLLALRSATPLCVEPSTASFLLPADLPYLSNLSALVRQEDSDVVEMAVCDEDYVEVSLYGTWLSSSPNSDEGVFVTAMSDRVEFFLFKVWQEAQTLASVARE